MAPRVPTPAKTSQAALVAIARGLVTQDGPEGVTLNAVAQSAGVKAPALLIVGDVTTFLAAESVLAAANKDDSMSHGALV